MCFIQRINYLFLKMSHVLTKIGWYCNWFEENVNVGLYKKILLRLFELKMLILWKRLLFILIAYHRKTKSIFGTVIFTEKKKSLHSRKKIVPPYFGIKIFTLHFHQRICRNSFFSEFFHSDPEWIYRIMKTSAWWDKQIDESIYWQVLSYIF